ncbi:hypothetical protein [Streptosporangium sp. CA-115845]|uniref:hypothetical protein n=1 Tax=Streptosporangium sp. CA-115845 TaxID=3240071 RepID=UPI003D8E31B9
MPQDLVHAIRHICAAVAGGDAVVYAEPGAIGIQVRTGSPPQELRRILMRIGWHVEQGRGGLLTVLGWSRSNLLRRVRILTLACADLREGYSHTVHAAIATAEQHLPSQTGANESHAEAEIVALAEGSADRALTWGSLLDEVHALARRSSDPQITAVLNTVLDLEAELAALRAEHLRAARRAAQVVWRCTHACLSPLTVRTAAWQESMRTTTPPTSSAPGILADA